MLDIDGLTKRYGDKIALSNLSFSVRPGEVYGFVGANGAGKTTAMRIMLGVLSADSGQVRWQGRPVTFETRRRFGYMPEERGLYPKMRVTEHLVYLARLHGLDAAAATRSADELTERLGVAERRADAIEKLSLGNQQRVQLAAALVSRPEVLILDEPFSGLDPVGVDSLAEALLEQCRAGVPVLFSSHQLDLVEDLCETITLLHHGRVVLHGDVRALRAQSPNRSLRVDVKVDPSWLTPDTCTIATVDASGTRLRLEPHADPGAVLDTIRAHVRVDDFGVEAPSLSELFLEAAGTDAVEGTAEEAA
jgi:ABC-2 type transport system ATP-binding protein